MENKTNELPDRPEFGDYQPKTMPDTVFDYLHKVCKDEKCRKKFEEIPQAKEENLDELMLLFKQYKTLTAENKGEYVQGNPLLGAPEKEYIPSPEELLLSEIGWRIEQLVKSGKKIPEKIAYTHFTITHVDVMGSGRFFYAESENRTIGA